MGTFTNKPFGFRMLGTFAPTMLLLSMSASAFAGMQVVYIDGKSKEANSHAPQVFQATEEDGTAKVIRANTKVDEQKPAEEFIKSEPVAEAPAPAPVQAAPVKKAPAAPAKFSAPAVVAEPATPSPEAIELAEIKRHNAELQKRLEVLEQARAAQKIEAAKEAKAAQAPAPADVTEEAANAQDVAPGADTKEEMKAEDVVESSTSPADLLDQRVKEKRQVSKAAKAELAVQQTAEQKQKELREKSGKFDQVPDQHIKDIAQRLKYTNEILKRFGRAYDYRLMTLAEFKKTLNELEQVEEKTKSAN
ncbi:MAG: hypothetical protein HY074_14120 [Deltaproteobacteria bacterium]|nr:hypothetical protein [Deltaproteobacteria bacterium]